MNGYPAQPIERPAWLREDSDMAHRWSALWDVMFRLGDYPVGPLYHIDRMELAQLIQDMTITKHDLDQALATIGEGEVEATTPNSV